MTQTIDKKVSILFTLVLEPFFIAIIIIFGFLTVYYKETSIVGGTILDTYKEIGHFTLLIMDTVFTLLGFGLLLSPYKNAKWTGMAVALFVVSFNIILGLLFQDMWFEIFFGFRKRSVGDMGSAAAPNAYKFWNRQSSTGKVTASWLSFRLSNICSTSYLVGMTAFSGKVSIQRIEFSLPIFCFLFYLNLYLNALVSFSTANKTRSFVYLDAYGTILVYLFGGVYGIIVGALTKSPRSTNEQYETSRKSRVSLQLALIGSFFLFATFILSYTGILTGLAGASQYFRFNSGAILVMFGLVAGIIGNFASSIILGGGRMNIESIIISTITGGIMVGGLADVIDSIGACLFIGFIVGIIAGAFTTLVTPRMNAKSIIDNQGLFGPILVVAFVACVVIHPSVLSQFYNRRDFLTVRGVSSNQTDYRVARYHLAYFAITLGIALVTGLVIGLIYKIKRRNTNDFEDTKFFAEDYGLYSMNTQTNKLHMDWQIHQLQISSLILIQEAVSICKFIQYDLVLIQIKQLFNYLQIIQHYFYNF